MKPNLGITDVMSVKGAVIQIHDDTLIASMRNSASLQFKTFKTERFTNWLL